MLSIYYSRITLYNDYKPIRRERTERRKCVKSNQSPIGKKRGKEEVVMENKTTALLQFFLNVFSLASEQEIH